MYNDLITSDHYFAINLI